MVAQKPLRTDGVSQVLRYVEGIWLHRKRRQIHKISVKTILLLTCATYSELQSYISTMRGNAMVLYESVCPSLTHGRTFF